jgi:hypothetical protein
VIELGGQIRKDEDITKEINKHTSRHTLGEIYDFIGLDMAQQVLKLQIKENTTP